MSWSIRPASESDAEAISTLILGLSKYFIPEPRSPEVLPFLETLSPAAIAKRIASPEFSYFVAEDEAHIQGVIGIQAGSHLYHLFVDSGRHREGLARSLWEHARKSSTGTAFTVNSSPFAVPVYERFGFQVAGASRRKDGLEFVPMEYSAVANATSGGKS